MLGERDRVQKAGGADTGQPVDWPELYAHVAIATGWTWEYIGEFGTLPRVAALNRALAAKNGVKPKDRGHERPALASVKPIDNAALTRNIKAFPRKDQWQSMNAPTLGGR